mmetsp:Transcript_4658/g.9253  ORF Transcript_4658/g.9253 Transcript_4658/m.9253 type:complete len:292 (+) Transcript_4658:56-931(+)
MADHEVGMYRATDSQSEQGCQRQALIWNRLSKKALLRVAVGLSAALGGFALLNVVTDRGMMLMTVEDVGVKDEDKAVFRHCLCVFDIDRTLTAKQGWAEKCKDHHVTELAGIQDEAYAKGTMIVSELAQSMSASFCGKCYHGIVTAGIASGPNSLEREHILEYLGGTARTLTDFWQDISFQPQTEIQSSLVVRAKDGNKQDTVKKMVQWWRNVKKIDIDDGDVYFFDDMAENVKPFANTGLNAFQVSCAVRGPAEKLPGAYDGKIGGCGGAFSELDQIAAKKGVHLCPKSK